MEYAVSLNKRIVTVRHQPFDTANLHPQLAAVQWVDFCGLADDFYLRFSELVRMLDTDRDHVRSHTKYAQRSLEWERAGGTIDLLLRGHELAVAQDWLQKAIQLGQHPPITELQSQFIQKSRLAHEARQRWEQRQDLILRLLLAGVSTALLITIGVGTIAFTQYHKARKILEEQIHDKTETVDLLTSTHRNLDAMLEALQAAKLRQDLVSVQPETQRKVIHALQQGLYNIEEYNRLEGHTQQILSIDTSKDGQWILTGSADRTARLWNWAGKLFYTFEVHKGSVDEVKFSPDSQLIATTSRGDKTVQIWTLEGENFEELFHRGNLEGGVDFSPDSRYLVTYNFDKKAKLWERETEAVYDLGHTDIVYGAVFGPNGQIATYSKDGVAKLWNLRRLREGPLQTFTHNDEIYNLAFSPDGTLIATASKDNTARLWNSGSGALVHRFDHHGAVNGLVFSHSGNQLITYSTDYTAKLWGVNGRLIKILNHAESVNGAVFSQDDDRVVTYSKDRSAIIWNSEGEYISTLKHQDEVYEAIIDPTGNYIATRSRDKTAILWGLDGAQLLTARHDAEVSDLRFHPREPVVLTRSKDSRFAQIWQAGSDHFTYLLGHQARVKDMAFAKNLIATADYRGLVRLWSRDSEHRYTYKLTFEEHLSETDPSVYQVDASPDGRYFTSASESNVVRLWNSWGREIRKFEEEYTPRFNPTQEWFATASGGLIKFRDFQGNLLKTLDNEEIIEDYTFSPHGELIAAAGRDGVARIWRVSEPEQSVNLKHNSLVASTGFSPDSRKLVTANVDGGVHIWSVNGQLLQSFPQQNGAIKSAEFSVDGDSIVTRRYRSHEVILWDLTGQKIATLAHDDEVNEFWVSPDAKYPIIATSSKDKTVKLWSKDGQELASFPHQAEVIDILFSPDGHQLITVTNDTDVKVWEINGRKLYTYLDQVIYLKDLISESCKALQSYLANQSVEDRIRRFCDQAEFSQLGQQQHV